MENGVNIIINHVLRELTFAMKYLVSYNKIIKGLLNSVH